MIPRWYGIAWRRYDANYTVCYPVPLNWIFRIARAFWITIKCPRPWQTELLECYKAMWGSEKQRADDLEKKAREYQQKAEWFDYLQEKVRK